MGPSGGLSLVTGRGEGRGERGEGRGERGEGRGERGEGRGEREEGEVKQAVNISLHPCG